MKRSETLEKILNTKVSCNTNINELYKLDELITDMLDRNEYDETTHKKIVRKHQEVISAIIIYQRLQDDEFEEL